MSHPEPSGTPSSASRDISDGDVMMRLDRKSYETPALMREYVNDNTLRPAEVMIFVKYRDEIVNRRVMDIGCGAGRVTRYLSRWTSHVVGIDYSSVMIEHCTRTFPRQSFRLCDAKDLSQFADESFDVAIFTFNGIDTLSHDDRMRALAGIRRILSKEGLFIFSSHNRRYRYARMGPRLRFARNPVTFAARVIRFIRDSANHSRVKRLERDTEEYALINDLAHEYNLLHYYIDRETQRKQLARAGFQLLEEYGEDGAVLRPGEDDSATGEMYYVARRI